MVEASIVASLTVRVLSAEEGAMASRCSLLICGNQGEDPTTGAAGGEIGRALYAHKDIRRAMGTADGRADPTGFEPPQ